MARRGKTVGACYTKHDCFWMACRGNTLMNFIQATFFLLFLIVEAFKTKMSVICDGPVNDRKLVWGNGCNV